jgi:hypothetical protein
LLVGSYPELCSRVARCHLSDKREELMIAILALAPYLTPLPDVLAVSPNRTFEVLLVVVVIGVAAVAAAIALRK